jgi:hypothetical protein
MNGRRKSSANVTLNQNSVQEGLDKSRKHQLWRRSNYIGIVVIIAFFLLAMGTLFNDIRGEYTCDNPRLGHVRLTIMHRSNKINCMLRIPKTHPFMCEVSDDGLKGNIVWSFKDSYATQGSTPMYFKGKINTGDGTISGVIQDGMNIYPITLKRDDFASLSHQVLGAIPGAS